MVCYYMLWKTHFCSTIIHVNMSAPGVHMNAQGMYRALSTWMFGIHLWSRQADTGVLGCQAWPGQAGHVWRNARHTAALQHPMQASHGQHMPWRGCRVACAVHAIPSGSTSTKQLLQLRALHLQNALESRDQAYQAGQSSSWIPYDTQSDGHASTRAGLKQHQAGS